MNGIEYKFYIDKLWVKQFDQFPNAVARVEWACVMKRNGAKIIGFGESYLEAPQPGAFIDISSLEAQQVIDWCIENEGGENWLKGYILGHEHVLEREEEKLSLERWGIPLINPLKFDPANV